MQEENKTEEVDMEEIRKFLSEPEEHQDEFWESDALIWVDWKNCLMQIKFSSSVQKQKKNAVLIFL